MIYETIDLYDYFKIKRGGATGGYLTAYARSQLSELYRKTRPAILVIPGGGYGMISGREGEPVALEFLSKGYAAFQLEYTVETAYPVPLNEAVMAMRFIRENAARFQIDSALVAAIGFSAGGHLAGLLSTVAEEEAQRAVGVSDKLVRPDAAILSYPVITMREELTHEGTKRIASDGGRIDCDLLSVEKRVTKECPPCFIWHTAADTCVPVENSLLLASACRSEGVPFSLHIFERGWHGLSLCNEETGGQTPEDAEHVRVGKWAELALSWLSSRGFSVKEAEA